MPDITMCPSAICGKASICYRHAASGTEPCEFRQSYFCDKEMKFPSCRFYWPIKEETV